MLDDVASVDLSATRGPRPRPNKTRRGGRQGWKFPCSHEIVLPREVLRMPPANTHITADQHNTLVEESSILHGRKIIATHHGGGPGDADGHARDAKHSGPPAYEGQLLRVLLGVEADFVGACSVGVDWFG